MKEQPEGKEASSEYVVSKRAKRDLFVRPKGKDEEEKRIVPALKKRGWYASNSCGLSSGKRKKRGRGEGRGSVPHY